MKHTKTTGHEYPTARKIRRDCSKELYRALKRMDVYVKESKLKEAELYYAKMVATHYLHLADLNKQRKKQVEWWKEHCSEQIATILDVNHEQFVQAFTQAYLGQ